MPAAALLRRAAVAAVASLAGAAPPAAAGGHFDVDDAAVLAPGRCQVEGWVLRPPGSGGRVAHLGPACRVGPFEVGLNLDRASSAAAGPVGPATVGPQVKWVVEPVASRLSAGLAAAVGWDRHGRAAGVACGLASWRAADALVLHVNVGVDAAAGTRRTDRLGASVEWAVADRTSLLAERIRIGGASASRLGVRFALGAATSIDFSAARSTAHGATGMAIGLNREWSR